ncbi:hypothetical protein [Micromonospora sediminimaris]|uniref:Uncharacterized protein n=1 Tax=Micromonospora sediminimaris TaxID=547162 RepID=A0A9W5UUQ2_9ACTN|nr:hypothetical protein [Micromonospora sediminimaris]GIJ35004.1 hypothetical protein Vse01_41520 [Micromonospora sediminimaris]SFD28556.1 hypothetical protein SAMN05216284_11484 [Micromonospora sediminimaris]
MTDALTSERPDSPTAVAPQPSPRPLTAFAGSPGRAVTILDAGASYDAVVLSPAPGTSMVRVLVDGQVRSVRADISAVPVTDPATALALTRQAVAWALTEQDSAVERARNLAEQRDEDRRRETSQLTEIRSYAIGQYREADITRDGLDSLLSRLDLDPYQPRHRVRFTISGSFDVIPDVYRDTEDTESDVRSYLRIDTDRVDNVEDDTVTIDVTADVEDLGD